MTITAKVIEDSTYLNAPRLTTLELCYPRFIHAEFMTHRVFSRNASSSRAIPVKRLTDQALENPAFFVHVGSNQPGMQAGAEVDEATRKQFLLEWNELANISAGYAMRWATQYGIHKQVVNRVMEPWHHIKVIVTATEWANFFELRNHPDAQPEIRVLAQAMHDAMEQSEPAIRGQISHAQDLPENWHLPYVLPEERRNLPVAVLVKLSSARCARVSYMNHDGTTPDVVKDLSLHEALVSSEPLHASPIEHQARPHLKGVDDCGLYGNFKSWVQYRKIYERNKTCMV